LLLAVSALAVTGVLWTVSPGFRQQVELSFTKEERPFTELYFSDVGALPKRLPAGTTSLTVPFSIVSHEGAPVDYRWQVRVSDGNATRTADSGSVVLRPGSSTEVAGELPGVRAGRQYRITVSLEGRPEHLHLVVGP
jgi:hypothetical protein